MEVKKKYMMAWAVFVVGAYETVFNGAASLGQWTAFGTMILAVFSAADVADKKLNGGKYDSRDQG
jgi:hypothetical protein